MNYEIKNKKICDFMRENNILTLDTFSIHDPELKVKYRRTNSKKLENYLWQCYEDGSGCLIAPDMQEYMFYWYYSKEYKVKKDDKNYNFNFGEEIEQLHLYYWLEDLERIFIELYVEK